MLRVALRLTLAIWGGSAVAGSLNGDEFVASYTISSGAAISGFAKVSATVTDEAGNVTGPIADSNQNSAVDRVAPNATVEVSDINGNTAVSSITNADTVYFKVLFTEGFSGVGIEDFVLKGATET